MEPRPALNCFFCRRLFVSFNDEPHPPPDSYEKHKRGILTLRVPYPRGSSWEVIITGRQSTAVCTPKPFSTTCWAPDPGGHVYHTTVPNNKDTWNERCVYQVPGISFFSLSRDRNRRVVERFSFPDPSRQKKNIYIYTKKSRILFVCILWQYIVYISCVCTRECRLKWDRSRAMAGCRIKKVTRWEKKKTRVVDYAGLEQPLNVTSVRDQFIA